MLRAVKSLEGYNIHATDGNIGELETIHFNDQSFDASYLVVKLGSFWDAKEVLILPTSAHRVDWVKQDINVDLSQEQIKKSVPYTADMPVEELNDFIDERNLRSLYLAEPWSGAMLPLWFPDMSEGLNLLEEVGDKHLRCVERVSDYKVDASDKACGVVDDFIIDDETWKLKYIVVDTNGILPFGKVLVSVSHIEKFDEDHDKVILDLSADEIKHCPAYDPSSPVNREYEVKYYDFEGRLKSSSSENLEELQALDKNLKG